MQRIKKGTTITTTGGLYSIKVLEIHIEVDGDEIITIIRFNTQIIGSLKAEVLEAPLETFIDILRLN